MSNLADTDDYDEVMVDDDKISGRHESSSSSQAGDGVEWDEYNWLKGLTARAEEPGGKVVGRCHAKLID